MSLIPQTPEPSEPISLRPFHPYEDETSPSPPVLTELDAFLDKVICDGRYVHELNEPLDVARKLGIEISPSVAEELKGIPPEKLLNRLYRARYPGNDQIQMLSPDVGILIVAAVFVTIAIVIVVVKWRGGKHSMVIDHSPHRESKL